MSLFHLKYPNKSHRKNIVYPQKSEELAEFMGIIIGDGGINNDWQLTVTVNSEADKDYSKYVMKLGKELFNIDAAPKKRTNRNALVLRFSSTNLVDFLVKMGSVRGNKIKQKIDIPKWIRGKKNFERAFVRGLIDTDGCLYIHRHDINGRRYNNLGFCFSSSSKNLMKSIGEIFKSNNLKPHFSKDMKKLYLYSVNAVEMYLHIFKTSNPRIENKYFEWKGA